MALTDARIRSAKPRLKPYRLPDGEGLFLFVTPAGAKSWRLRYRVGAKEKLLVLGSYPEMGLVDARKRRRAAKDRIDEGGDPALEKQATKRWLRAAAELTFEIVAREWHDNAKGAWDEKYADLIMRRLQDNIFPAIGALAITAITPPQMLAALKKVEARGVLETTRRVKQYCSNAFCYAIAAGYCSNDPTVAIRRALKPPGRPIHRKRLPHDQIGEFLIKLDGYDGDIITRAAIGYTMLTVARTKEIIPADWCELEHLDDPSKALWRIPAMRMKMHEEHIVPLSRQAVALLLTLPSANERKGRLFPGSGAGGLISNNTMLFGLYRMGYHSRATMHGFRGMFSTEANEHDFEEDWIERQLAHDERNDVRAAYNAAQYLPQRRRLMQWWSDYLDELKAQAAVHAPRTFVD